MDILKNILDGSIKFGKHRIGVIIDTYNDIWFNATDSMLTLGYAYPKSTRRQIPKKDQRPLKHINHDYDTNEHPNTVYVNEAGLYKLILRSRMPKAEQFTDWITHVILPSIRKFGKFKLITEHDNEIIKIMDKINRLEKENNRLKRHYDRTKRRYTKAKGDLKKKKYPKGDVVYAIDYSTKNKKIYRIGRTKNMAQRKKIYDTHTRHNYPVVIIMKSNCAACLESCIRAMLDRFRYQDNKDFFVCELNTIKLAFNQCSKDLETFNKMAGGSKSASKNACINKLCISRELTRLKNRKTELQNRIQKLTKQINC